jgi:acetone carboxylase gamma subunit
MTEIQRAVPVHEYLLLEGEGASASLICAQCRTRICGIEENYRLQATLVSVPATSLGPLFKGSERTVDEEIVWRTYHCPSCGQQLDGEICPASADILWDLQLSTEGGLE